MDSPNNVKPPQISDKPWFVNGYRVIPLAPLPFPPKTLPHKLGYIPTYMKKISNL